MNVTSVNSSLFLLETKWVNRWQSKYVSLDFCELFIHFLVIFQTGKSHKVLSKSSHYVLRFQDITTVMKVNDMNVYFQLIVSRQSCPTLCDPIDGSPPGSPIPGVLQARTLEWVAISFSNAWKWKVKVKSLSRVQLFATPWTAAFQAPPSMGFSRQEYRSGLPVPSPVDC